MLAVSRQQVMHSRAMDLVAQVRSLESMLRRVLGEDVELVVETGDEPASVFADPASP